MTDEQTTERINSSLAEEFEYDLEKMSAQTLLFEDMGLDSLDVVDLVIVLETEFGVKIREEEAIRKIRTLGDIHSFIIDKLHQAQSA
jgi:acyl carrier protein